MAKKSKSANKDFPKKKKAIATPKAISHDLGFFSNTRIWSVLIFLFAFLLYGNTIEHQYTQDDAIVIYDNMFTTEGVSGIPGILKNDTFYGFFKVDGKAGLVSGGRYRPLTLVMFALEWQLFGKTAYITHVCHFINILLYAFTCLVLYRLLLRILPKKKNPVYAGFIALGTTLLFASHPIHTEVVANIKGRDEILTLLGSLYACYIAIKAHQDKKPILLIGSAIVFFLSLFSKENAITFVAVIPLTMYFFTKANLGEIVGKYFVPFLVAAVGFIAVRTMVIGFDLGGTPQELMNNPYLKIVGNKYVPFSAGEKMATIIYTLGLYVKLLIFPHPLTHDYYPRHIDLMTWGNWKVILSLLVYVGMAVYAFIGLRKKDIASYAILFFLLTLSIVSNIVFPIGTNMSERFMFMPSVGFCLLVSVLLYRGFNRKNEVLTSFKTLMPAFGIIGLITILFSVKTISRNFAWENNYTLFMTDIETSTRSAKLLNAVGGELSAQASNEKDEVKRNAMLNKAVKNLNEAVKIHPTYKNAYLLLGNANNYLNKFDESIKNYERALQLDPNFEDAHNNLNVTYRNAGQYYGEKKGDLTKAQQYLNIAYQRNPKDYDTLRLLGVSYGIQKNSQKAIEFFTKAIEVSPQNADAYINLSSAYYYAGNQAKADELQAKALQLDPQVLTKRGNK